VVLAYEEKENNERISGAGISLGMAWIAHWWFQLSSVSRVVVSVAVALVALSGGLKVISSLWQCVIGKYDARVLEPLEYWARKARQIRAGVAMNAPTAEIAAFINRDEKCGEKALVRLAKQKKVLEHPNGWSLYPDESVNPGRRRSRFGGSV